jgi:hypothetical protein
MPLSDAFVALPAASSRQLSSYFNTVQGQKTKRSLLRLVVKVTQTVAVTGTTKNCGHTVKVKVAGSNKVALWLINCANFNSFLVYKHLNRDLKLKYKAFV